MNPNIRENEKSVTAEVVDDEGEVQDKKRFEYSDYPSEFKTKMEANNWLRSHEDLESL